MNVRPQAPRRLRRSIGHSTLVVGSAGLAVLCAGAATTPSLAPAAAQVLRMQPDRLIGRLAPVGRNSTRASSSAPCWASSNWSGYALSASTPSGLSCVPASGTTYTSVSATWTVPTVTGSSSGSGRHSRSSSTYSAVWTGIDGFSDDDLIQAGTEQNYSGGSASYTAWWEILPAAETVIPSITVDPGDQITVTITKGGCSSVSDPWLITLTDNGQSGRGAQPEFSTCQSYTGPQSSAEWIVEAPEVNGRIASIADYGTATFGLPSVLTANGVDTDLATGNSGELEQNGSVVSICSSPAGGDAFSCAYGSSPPAAP